MILTEVEAKTKWCPYARVIFNSFNEDLKIHAATSYNRSSDPSVPLACCLGSGCMVWVWVDGEEASERRGMCGGVR